MAGAPPPMFFPPPPTMVFPASYTHFSAGMAIIIVVLVSAFFIMGFFSVYVKRCATSEYEAQLAHLRDPTRVVSSRPEPGLDKALYEAFPLVKYSELKSYKTAKETTECVVCLSDFEGEEELRLLPKCDHFFHPECIDAWFQSHTTCPLCRCSLGPPVEMPVGRGGAGFWGSGGSARRTSSNHIEPPDLPPESTSNGDVVVTIHDQDAIDLEQLRAFLRAGSLRGQSGRRGASFRMAASATDPLSAESKLDDGNEAIDQPRPGEAELKRSLSRNSLSFRQAVRGMELQEYLSSSSFSQVDPAGKLEAPNETSGGAILEKSRSSGRLGSSLRRSSSLNAREDSPSLPREGEDLVTLEETSQEFSRCSEECPGSKVESYGFSKSEIFGSDDSDREHGTLVASASTKEVSLTTDKFESKADVSGDAC